MRNIWIIVAAAIILVTLLIAAVFFLTSETTNVTTQPTPVQIPSPTESSELTMAGTITQIQGQVGYKNSLVVNINETTNIYITDETKITGPDGTILSRAAVREGFQVLIDGIPAEGGIEATSIKIISTTSPTPTKIQTATTSAQ